MSYRNKASTWNAMDHAWSHQLTAAGTCVTGERLSRERLANQRRKQAQAKQAPPAGEPPVPEHIAEQRKREKEAQQDAVMEQVRKKLEAQFGVGAVQVFTRRSE